MPASLQGVKPGSLVHRFIASGKPGYCELCDVYVEKLEAHHIKYSPEITIKICHLCHHKAHFWPNRLTKKEKFKILQKVHPVEKASQLAEFKFADVSALAKIIAPSRNEFIHAAQKLEQQSIEASQNHTTHKSPKIVHRDEHVLRAISSIPRPNLKKKNI